MDQEAICKRRGSCRSAALSDRCGGVNDGSLLTHWAAVGLSDHTSTIIFSEKIITDERGLYTNGVRFHS
jgi:hypothetical protein